MHRIDSSTATPDNRFTEGDPTIPVPATTVTDDWLNAVQEELIAILAAANITPDKANNAQVLAAIQRLIADKTGIAKVGVNGLVNPDGVTILIDGTGKLSSVAQSSLPAGYVALLPFRAADLAAHCPGWHFCNGDQYALTSPVGTALNALPENFKADWGIVVSGANISIPNMFYSDGRGYFLRSVDGTTRQVGSVELDQFQTHTHIVGEDGLEQYTRQEVHLIRPNTAGNVISSGPTGRHGIETRSLNVGMTPAIFLDV